MHLGTDQEQLPVRGLLRIWGHRRCLVLAALTAGALIGLADAGGFDPLEGNFPIRFDSERIRLHIVGDSLEVRGTYYLVCVRQTRGEIPLFYPFPDDSLLGGARMVALTARAASANIPREEARPAAPARWESLPRVRGVRWWMPPCTGDTLVAESVYRQKLHGEYARYIVTSTRAWNRPLRRAQFEIHLPDGVTPTEFSFPFTKRNRNGQVYYSFEADSFFPDRDIIVRWEH